uniref:ATP synthase F0 subunit 8 n=1 Tax=Oligolophus tienmushanensis TaxID=1508515 RepID=A0A140X726_9ARAC|nr:ATP synthase F0 subunit 8 [Oligolophus tienmushanensis]AIG60111.1 ATP synthase F0 subunit 8 [Oligolophus tienmushanensis]
MFPMNWWLMSLIPFLLILMNMMLMQFITTMKKNEMKNTKFETTKMMWKW